MKNCEYCGKPFKGKRESARYCSTECFNLARGAKSYVTTHCELCGKPFKETRDRPNLFCSKRCSSLFNAMTQIKEAVKNREIREETANEFEELVKRFEEIKYRVKHEKQCVNCGKWFLSKNGNRCCSEECQRKADNARRDKRIYKNGKPDFTITLTRVYMRDNGVCQLCGKRIDFDCDIQSFDYPSIDHITPLSRGGTHTWDNVQLACRGCNTRKGNRA